ncbi:MAG TPA: DUF5666 domain-containing protein [Terriglobales bacterium]|nr:DUF5666 domain-containing protein [Terriglobales bacterium]
MVRIGAVHKSFQAGTLLTVVSVLLWTSCGGMSNGPGATLTPIPRGSTPIVVSITDSPSDRVVSFELTIDSITLTATDGSTVVLSNSSHRVEVTHLSGSAEPLLLTSIPQGTYTAAKVVVSKPDVAFIDDSGHEIEKNDVAATQTINITLNPPLVVANTPVVLTVDFNAAGSIDINLATGTVTVNAEAEAHHDEVPGGSQQDGEDVDNGELEHVIGQVSGVSGAAFTVSDNVGGTTITFVTDGNTKFEDGATLASLVNAMVRVEAETQQNGQPLAKEIELLNMNGSEAEGLITATTGSPVTSFTVVVHDGSGLGMTDSMLGTTLTLNVNDQTRFRVDAGDIQLGGLNLPDFNASSLSKGQRVEADAENSVTEDHSSDQGGTGGAVESVKLERQALTGTVSNPSNSQFTLTLADDSAFKLLTGVGTLTVLMQQNTDVKDIAVSSGANVRVRGLLFFDPNSGSLTMVAGRISAP